MKIRLSDTFIENCIATLTPHWGSLGWVTYKRTYARWLPELQRTEEWHETVRRVVEGNINLDPRLTATTPDVTLQSELQAEAEQVFKVIYSLAATPSGRNLWISGTDYQQRNGDALNNCWFIGIRPQPYGASHIVPPYVEPAEKMVSMPFAFLFDQLMKGGGVGFSVVPENLKQLPIVNNAVTSDVIIAPTATSFTDSLNVGAKSRETFPTIDPATTELIQIPDTREGWVEAVAYLIDAHFLPATRIKHHLVFDISAIRPKDSRINGFGGTASGPMPLVELLIAINDLLNQHIGERLSAVDCTDIANLIGKTVVAGNVRRSAEIALGAPNDTAFVTMKQDKAQLYHHRWASNNSVIIDQATTDFEPLAAAIAQNGEPGIINLDMIKNYGRLSDGYQAGIDALAEGTNPCGEISLANGEPCNLFEIFPAIAIEQGFALNDICELAVRFAKRITFSPYDWEVSRNIIAQNRRIGISLSGIQDWALSNFSEPIVTGFTQVENGTQEPIYNQAMAQALTAAYQAVVAADIAYSQELNCAPSVKRTTVKPSGTVSKLVGASEGMHFPYSAYLIQRIRFQDSDPLLPALAASGYRMEPDVYSANTMCVEFPIKAPMADHAQFLAANDVPLAVQMANQAFLQTYWSDNSVSCTLTFNHAEQAEIAPLLHQYQDRIKSTSMLPYSDNGYEQAPKEPISATVYHNRLNEITGNVQQLANYTELGALELVDASDCESGACPIR
ncbi:ribonucleoside-triphosphate reductase, adenosylcobalamin-dependent [Periweissella cryptocerci]|uniref:Adenosylcobalamin-dependent ribonucleoside-triphosphate reductase n=1 Tax=Periweissella cryptocerci TaxID=2506420 RepID=A0A4P6YSH6_9LACO|nr:ribonucleoside-triphosphate reductase, adenosylcobalamin-dependent [Periweissella cryptocerci]QBO35577.1 ribonucleoside-triphosphate reductase, adenosylcobalamin-dependent [Periweissella cryptocerci]